MQGLRTTLAVSMLSLLGIVAAWGQASNVGSVTATVLELKDLGTNDVRRAPTTASGTYTFPNLQFGTYQLSISAAGFQNQVFESVQVQTARNTSITATLQVGGTSQTVTVAASEAP